MSVRQIRTPKTRAPRIFLLFLPTPINSSAIKVLFACDVCSRVTRWNEASYFQDFCLQPAKYWQTPAVKNTERFLIAATTPMSASRFKAVYAS